ncbi:hypothetical protein BC831DRAFT_447459 [Entophlyctis helioformis]|nr:hypothetical protein BC831DRAFT_447459 [Entophlyctis helioformis]
MASIHRACHTGFKTRPPSEPTLPTTQNPAPVQQQRFAMAAPADCAIVVQAFPQVFSNVTDCCTFPGIACKNGRVTTLNLDQKGLTGNIPPSLGKLNELEYLSLFLNEFSGSIPDSLGDLEDLKLIDLADNDLTGPIPASFGRLKELTLLSLDMNYLSGEIPASLGQLKSLETILIYKNNLEGTLPESVLALPHLKNFLFYDNAGLKGSLPANMKVNACSGFNTSVCAPNVAMQNRCGIQTLCPGGAATDVPPPPTNSSKAISNNNSSNTDEPSGTGMGIKSIFLIVLGIIVFILAGIVTFLLVVIRSNKPGGWSMIGAWHGGHGSNGSARSSTSSRSTLFGGSVASSGSARKPRSWFARHPVNLYTSNTVLPMGVDSKTQSTLPPPVLSNNLASPPPFAPSQPMSDPTAPLELVSGGNDQRVASMAEIRPSSSVSEAASAWSAKDRGDHDNGDNDDQESNNRDTMWTVLKKPDPAFYG